MKPTKVSKSSVKPRLVSKNMVGFQCNGMSFNLLKTETEIMKEKQHISKNVVHLSIFWIKPISRSSVVVNSYLRSRSNFWNRNCDREPKTSTKTPTTVRCFLSVTWKSWRLKSRSWWFSNNIFPYTQEISLNAMGKKSRSRMAVLVSVVVGF